MEEVEDIIRDLPTRRENMVMEIVIQTTEEATIEDTREEMAMTSLSTAINQKDTVAKTDSLVITMENTSKYPCLNTWSTNHSRSIGSKAILGAKATVAAPGLLLTSLEAMEEIVEVETIMVTSTVVAKVEMRLRLSAL